MKVGRNDPCPCGSGKKYKKCCMEDGNIIPFPGSKDTQMDEYKNYCEFAHENGLPIPSFMEFIGQPNPASDFLGDIKKEIADMEFSSIDEVNKFLQKKISKDNNSPKGDFLGLSSSQVHQLIELPHYDNDLVSINEDIESTVLEQVPIVRDIMLFLIILSQNDGTILLNPSGKIQKKYCIEFAKYKYGDDFPASNIKSEEDLPELKLAIFTLHLLECIDVLKTRIKLTDYGYEALLEDDIEEFFYEILDTFIEDYWWLSGSDMPEELGFIQNSVMFSLYILKTLKGKTFILDEVFDLFAKAFPDFVKEHTFDNGFSLAEFVFQIHFIKDFCSSFGLIEAVYSDDLDKININNVNDIKFKTTEFFDMLFQWKC